MSAIQYGANFQVIGKTDPQKLSHAEAFQPVKGSLGDLAIHIGKGYPWMPALLDKGARRWQQFANHAELLAIDIDQGMSIDQALQHPFIAAYCGLGIESSSSTPEHQKFRLVFRLPEAVTDWQIIRICNRYLIELLGVADPSCKDASRFFFGGLGRSPFLLNESAALPADFVQQAIAWHTEQERVVEAAYQAALSRRQQYQSSSDDLLDRVKEALSFIPPRAPGSNNYPESIRVLMALTNEFGESVAIALGEWWSPSIKGSTWDVPRKVASFKRSASRPVTIATVFKLAIQNGYRPPQREADPFGWLRRIIKTKAPKADPVVQVKLQPEAQPQPEAYPIHEYEKGYRLDHWQQAAASHRYVLDLSITGSGKSYDAGRVEPRDFGVGQIIYISQQHRNPTVETLEAANGWVDLEARHAGLTREATTGGGSRVRRSKNGEAYNVAPNCIRTGMIAALQAKHIQDANTASTICGTCKLKDVCRISEGTGYGFLNQRRSALASPKMRAHPASLPDPDDYDYSAVSLVWDEPSQGITVKRDVIVTLRDLEQTICASMKEPALFAQLQPLLTALLPYLDGSIKAGKFGLDHAGVMALLPNMDTVDHEEVARVLSPDLSFLDVSDSATVADEQVVKQWLPALLQMMISTNESLHLANGVLTISLPEYRHRKIAAAAKTNIFLDATLSREDLALKLGCSPDEIYVCRQRVLDAGNLTIIQVTGLGRLGMQRGADQQRRATAVASHYQAIDSTAKMIDFKRFAEKGAGVWWRDSRGVNDFEQATTLILVGTPCRNLMDLKKEYSILTGCSTEGDDFQAWVDRQIRADILQAIGRQRANRRPDEKLQVILLSDFDLGIPTTQVSAASITPEAGSKQERVVFAARRAIEQLKAAGQKVTQTAIAAIVTCTQSTISKLWEFITFAINDSHSKSDNSDGLPPDPDSLHEVEAVVQVVEALAIEATPQQMLESLPELLLEMVQPEQWSALWQRLSDRAQSALLGILLLILPDEQLEQIIA